MLVFPNDLNQKMTSFREKTAFYIFNYLCKGFLLRFQKMTWVVFTKLKLLQFKTTYGPKTYAEDVKKVKIESYKV